MLVEDRFDPYSVDLTTCFRKAVQRVAPAAEISEQSDSLGEPQLRDPQDLPGPAEEALAETICHDAETLPDGQTTWVFLPLQEEPAQRMLQALRKHARRPPKSSGNGPLHVICGDAIGASILAEMAGHCPFPVWSVSSMATKPPDTGLSADVWVQAEMIAAVLRYLEKPAAARPSPDGFRDALASLKLGPEDQASPGRSLSFSRSGERIGGDLGHVLLIRPDQPEVFSVTRDPDGRWHDPEPLPLPAEPGTMAARP